MTELLEPWRRCWRDAVAPLLSDAALAVLARALASDDPTLVQGQTVLPLFPCPADWPAEGACLLGYCGWRGEGLRSVGEIHDYFGDMCGGIDALLHEVGGCRHLLVAYDGWPREEMLRQLLPEVEREQARRKTS